MKPRRCACGAYLQQHGWTNDTVPSGERLEREHRDPNCPARKTSSTHADQIARGKAEIHVYIDANVVTRAKEAAQGLSLGQVVAEALEAHLDGETVRIPNGLEARCIAAGCGVDVTRLVEVALAEFMAQDRAVIVAKLRQTKK